VKAARPESSAEYRRSRSCLRIVYRLQKSTSGAWPRAPAREERAEAAWSSPLSNLLRGARAGESASEAGAGRQSPVIGGGSAFEVRRESAGPSGHSSMEDAPDRGNRLPLTRRRGTRSWRRAGASARCPSRQERQRSHALLVRGRQRREPRGALLRAPHDRGLTRISRRPHSPDRRERDAESAEARGAPSSAP
jgi:hypothetical protein